MLRPYIIKPQHQAVNYKTEKKNTTNYLLAWSEVNYTPILLAVIMIEQYFVLFWKCLKIYQLISFFSEILHYIYWIWYLVDHMYVNGAKPVKKILIVNF